MKDIRRVRIDMDDCLVPIPWETRNLGLESFKVTDGFIHNPSEKTLESALKKKIKEHSRIFIQARISKDNYRIIPLLGRNNFYFVETVLVPYTTLETNLMLNHFIANKSEFLPKQYDVNGWEVAFFDKNDVSLCRSIKNIAAESFVDDRFHCDQQCDKAIADRRFSYWVDDLLADAGVIFHIITYHSEPVGFIASKSDDLILAGLSRKYVGKGIGTFFWLSILEDMLNKGYSRIHSMISTNNTPILNLYVKLGFRFKDPAATLHYWHTC